MDIGILRWDGDVPEALIKGRKETIRFPGETIDSLVSRQPMLPVMVLIDEDSLINAFVFLHQKTVNEMIRNTLGGEKFDDLLR